MFDPSVCYENSRVRSFTMGESLSRVLEGQGFNKMSFFPFRDLKKMYLRQKHYALFVPRDNNVKNTTV